MPLSSIPCFRGTSPAPQPASQHANAPLTARRHRLSGHRRSLGIALTLAAALQAVAPAGASSPEAWNRYDRQVRSACVAASALAAVRVRGSRLDLPALGISSLLLEGTYPQAHMKGQQGLELCVFEQRSGRAAVAEADGWRPSVAAPATPAPSILPMPGAALPGRAAPAGSPMAPR